ncbi:MAG: M15 family metallopeptidase, partial [Ruminiclostridium sp.]
MTKRIYFIIIIVITFTLILPNVCSDLVSAADTKAVIKKQDLVLVKDYSKDFAIEMRYATYDNFVKKTLYPSPTCVLTKGTLDKLIKANNLVKNQGYSIKILDAYRPLSVQKIMWEATPNKNYVANPYRSGSKHNRGAAVDVTLVDKNGKDVKMPTEFDNFTAKASPNYKDMSQEQRKNLDV